MRTSRPTVTTAIDTPAGEAPQPTPFVPDHQGDEHWGMGGRYVVVDGKRIPAPAEPEPVADIGTVIEQPTVKDQDNG